MRNFIKEHENEHNSKSDVKCDPDENSEQANTSELLSEDKLVDYLCKLFIPNVTVLEECHGIEGWHTRASSVLSFCSSVSNFPVTFHALRIFNDLATVLLYCKIDLESAQQYLLQLASGVDLEDLEKQCRF